MCTHHLTHIHMHTCVHTQHARMHTLAHPVPLRSSLFGVDIATSSTQTGPRPTITTNKPRKPCNCKNSQCLKLWVDYTTGHESCAHNNVCWGHGRASLGFFFGGGGKRCFHSPGLSCPPSVNVFPCPLIWSYLSPLEYNTRWLLLSWVNSWNIKTV